MAARFGSFLYWLACAATLIIVGALVPAALALADAGQLSSPYADGLVSACEETTITKIGSRVGGPDGGIAVSYANGKFQVSYDRPAEVLASRAGDRVIICLMYVPQGCPPGDDRGRVYMTHNLRTGKTWTMADATHVCGGA